MNCGSLGAGEEAIRQEFATQKATTTNPEEFLGFMKDNIKRIMSRSGVRVGRQVIIASPEGRVPLLCRITEENLSENIPYLVRLSLFHWTGPFVDTFPNSGDFYPIFYRVFRNGSRSGVGDRPLPSSDDVIQTVREFIAQNERMIAGLYLPLT